MIVSREPHLRYEGENIILDEKEYFLWTSDSISRETDRNQLVEGLLLSVAVRPSMKRRTTRVSHSDTQERRHFHYGWRKDSLRSERQS